MTQDGKTQSALTRPRTSLAAPAQRVLPAEGGMREFLAFVVGEESYALPLSSVQEIMKLPPVTEVPRGPHHVLGIISVRGRVTTVIDMRRRLRMRECPITQRSRVLLVDNAKEIMGLLVDGVLGVYRLHENEVEYANVMGGDTSDYVIGIGRPGRHGRGRHAASATEGRRRRRPVLEPDGTDRRKANRAPSTDAEILVLLDPVELLEG